jgi:H+-translocating diphosphatase
MSLAILPLVWYLPEEFVFVFGNKVIVCTPWKAYTCVMCGLWSGYIIGIVTEMYTSNAYRPV